MQIQEYSINFSTPIKEYSSTDNEFLIKGTAITQTTTHNNHKYIAEELEKAAPSLNGKPLLVDHDNRIESIKGRVTNSFFDPMTKSIQFEGRVMDKDIKEMIRDGRINNVSIGAFAKDLIKEEDGSYVAKGIKIAELSFVAVPADENANFAMAFDKSYNLKESLKEKMIKCPDCEKEFEDKEQMEKHRKSKHKEMEEEKFNTYTNERRLNMTEENKVDETQYSKIVEELNILKQEKRNRLIEEYKNLCAQKKVTAKETANLSEEVVKLLTEQVSEIKVIEAPKEMKSIIMTETPELNSFVIGRNESGKSEIFEMPDMNKLRKLHRDHSSWNMNGS